MRIDQNVFPNMKQQMDVDLFVIAAKRIAVYNFVLSAKKYLSMKMSMKINGVR